VSANLASLVNQQLYHAQLLLDMMNLQDPQQLHYRAAKQALLNAAVQATFLAYQGFLAETADSCQLKSHFDTVQQLQMALQSEGRSHAIVSNLSALLTDGADFHQQDSWLQQLISAEAGLLQAAPAKSAPKKQANMIIQVQKDTLDEQAVSSILLELKQFIDAQRDYLQEW
jgi:hypothetical protein